MIGTHTNHPTVSPSYFSVLNLREIIEFGASAEYLYLIYSTEYKVVEWYVPLEAEKITSLTSVIIG